MTGASPDNRHSHQGAGQFQLFSPDDLIVAKGQHEGGSGLVILEAHFSSVDHPLDPKMPIFRHIPDAIQVHPSYLEAGLKREKYYPNYDHPEEAKIMKGQELTDALEHLGIHPDSTVVVYGSDPDGVMAAARLVWGLMYAGVREIRLLDGGIDAWIYHGQRPAMTIRNVWELPQIDSGSNDWNFHHDFLAESDEIQNFVITPDSSSVGKLIDVRTDGEWDGTTPMKYTFFSRAGHIPGAIHQGDWENLLDGTSKRLAPHLEVVKQRWQAQGIIDDGVESGATPLTFHCGTGWRSSIAFLIAHLLGYRARNYEEGFFGWSHDPQNPVERIAEATPSQ